MAETGKVKTAGCRKSEDRSGNCCLTTLVMWGGKGVGVMLTPFFILAVVVLFACLVLIALTSIFIESFISLWGE